MTLHSKLYIGQVRHRRRTPAHEFTFPLFMAYLDLDELDLVFSISRWWSTSAWSPARFVREDYLQRGSLGLAASVRQCVEEQLGLRVSGPIRMLTHVRTFGYVFNPVTFYYCFNPSGDAVDAVVAEITNTPWKERHAYALSVSSACRTGRSMRWRFGKEFHVSPFLPMGLEYDWALTPPAETLFVHMALRDQRSGLPRVFDATLQMRRRELTPSSMRDVLLRYPLLTARVIGRIHLEAARLWLKRAPVFTHPSAGAGSRPGRPAHAGVPNGDLS